MLDRTEIDADLKKVAPGWIAYLEKQAEAVNHGEQNIEAGCRKILQFAMKAIVDVLAKAAVRQFLSAPMDYRDKRRIVRVLGHRIRQLREQASQRAGGAG